MNPPGGTATPIEPAALRPGARWSPVIGDRATALMNRQTKLSVSAREEVVQAAAGILSQGQDPRAAEGNRTGLVVGYVQSGKTLSFTTVVALARDNAIPLVIVIAGTSEPLFNQTRDRLSEELCIDDDDIPPSWMHISNPELANEGIVSQIFRNWRDPEVIQEHPATLLMTVMKQHQRLKNLNDLLARLDLRGIPAIIVDDEADQASLNTGVNQGNESRTYERLLEIKASIPNHTFLQYTATPQATLLINIIDALSPNFVEVLEPGAGYVGGTQFFGADRRFARTIPAADIPSKANPITTTPPSLLEALAFFFVSVAAGLIEGWSKSNPNRSMLVHPSRTTQEHFQYYQSIRGVITDWHSLLTGPETEPDRRELIEVFQAAYNDLATTADNLPSFDEVLLRLPKALNSTQVREVNRRTGRKSPPIEWKQAYAWVLVGGQQMDRGFTVRELSVTYMPRGTGVGNADTLQQRARFFGYKERYLGHCRLYLENAALMAFRDYVEHEEEMRQELISIQNSGMPLSTWKRKFILDPSLRPCRANVIQHDFARGNFGNDWFYPAMVKMSAEAIAANNNALDVFIRTLRFEPDTSYLSDQIAQQHLVADGVPLKDVVENLLVNYRIQDATDSAKFVGLMLQFEKALERNGGELARVYQMRPGYTASRTIDDNGRIPSIGALQQGPTRSPTGYSYPGDRDFRDRERVSVQIHHFDLLEGAPSVVVRQNAPVLAIWVPQRMEMDWIAQDQGG